MVKLADLPAGRQARTLQNMYQVYVLDSKIRKYIYVGLTNNAEKRIAQHQAGRERTTAPYRPFRVLLLEQYTTRQEARNREKYLKSGSGKEWIKRSFK